MSQEKINHPSHYAYTAFEAYRVIEAWDLGFYLGNVVKYIARCERKGNKLEDLKKAQWYLNRYIELTQENQKETLANEQAGRETTDQS